MSETTVQRLFSFIEQSPTAFHAIEYMRKKLLDEGYIQLLEGTDWQLTPGKGYFVIRNGSAILAFRIPEGAPVGFQIMASHSDSPMFKIKAYPEMEAEGHYVRLNVEKYGGMLCAPWFDRPLSVAGRLIVQTAEGDFLVRAAFMPGEWLISFILSYGAHARVVEPKALADAVSCELEKMSAQYKT